MTDSGLLRDRVAIVAGVGPELGRSIALALAREGAHLALGDSHADAVGGVAAEIRDRGGRVLESTVDVTRADDCRRLVEQALDAYGRIDVLVNNTEPPKSHGEKVAEADPSDWRDAFEADVLGALRLIQEVIRPMRSQRSGSIVVIGALETRLAAERGGALSVARGALLMATQTLAREVGPDGIRVNTVVPGFVEGPRMESILNDRVQRVETTRQELRNRIIEQHALGRLTDPGEVSDAVVFLASDLSRIVTGQSLDVNCGRYFH